MVDSIIGDAYPAGEVRRRALAGFGAALAVAEALVPFLGGAMDAWRWEGIFALYGTALLAGVLTLTVRVPMQHEIDRLTGAAYAASIRVALRIRALSTSLLGAVFIGLLYFGFCSLLPSALPTRHGGLMSGLLFLPIGVTWVGTSLVLAKRPHIHQPHVIAAISSVVLVIATAVPALWHSLWLVLLISGVWGVCVAAITTIFTWVVGDESPAEVRGALNGLYNASYVLGFSVGAPIFLYFNDRFGYPIAMGILTVGLLGVTGLLWFGLVRLGAYSDHDGSGIVEHTP